MPVVKGRVREKSVDVLRDTGCSGIVVKKDLVAEDQFTGDFNVMLLIDNTARKVPIAKTKGKRSVSLMLFMIKLLVICQELELLTTQIQAGKIMCKRLVL